MRAELLAPLAIVLSIAGSWIIGIAYMLSLLFSVQSIPAIQQTTLALPIAQLFSDAAGSRLALLCLFMVGLAQGMAAATAFTASARLLYALARDNAVPAAVKVHLMKLNRGQAPYVGVWISVLIGCVISCAYIGSSIAVRPLVFLPEGRNLGCFNTISVIVQCDPFLCRSRSDVELPAAYYYTRLLAPFVCYNVPHFTNLQTNVNVQIEGTRTLLFRLFLPDNQFLEFPGKNTSV